MSDLITFTEKFIEKANKIHNEFYIYSKFKYNGNHTKGTIICPKHGEWEQTPANHLANHGCPICAKEKQNNPQKHLDNFIIKSNKIHSSFYDYNQFVWTGSQSKGTIICPNHGPFQKTPEKHIQKQGCQVCSRKKKSKDKKHTIELFVNKATEIHGDVYDYSYFNYIDGITKGKIICKLHGPFEQTPSHHLSGHGCKECGKQKGKETQLKRYGMHHSKSPLFGEKNSKN